MLRTGGELVIQVPHFSSRQAYLDPTHVRPYAAGSFEYFVRGHQRNYYAEVQFSEMVNQRITFDLSYHTFWNYALVRLVNLSPRWQRFYESTPLRVFPALNLTVTLRK